MKSIWFPARPHFPVAFDLLSDRLDGIGMARRAR